MSVWVPGVGAGCGRKRAAAFAGTVSADVSGRQPLPGPFLWMFSGGCCCGGAGGTVRAQSFSGVRIVCLRSGFCRFPGRKEDFSRKIVIFAPGASVYGSSERKR